MECYNYTCCCIVLQDRASEVVLARAVVLGKVKHVCGLIHVVVE